MIYLNKTLGLRYWCSPSGIDLRKSSSTTRGRHKTSYGKFYGRLWRRWRNGYVFLKSVNVQATTMGFSFEHNVILLRSCHGKTVSAPFQSMAMINIPEIHLEERDLSMKGSLMESLPQVGDRHFPYALLC